MKISVTEHFILVCSNCYSELPTRMAGISDGKTGYRKIEVQPCKNCMQDKISNTLKYAIKKLDGEI